MAQLPKTIVYSEPEDYFPEKIRKKCKLGEYAESNTNQNDAQNKDAEKTTQKKQRG